MAEFIMKDLIQKNHLETNFEIESAATSCEELGNPVYPPVKRLLRAEGMDCSAKRARQVIFADYARFDKFFVMDCNNLYRLKQIFKGDSERKIEMLGKYLKEESENREIADPWYSGDFLLTWDEIQKACKNLLAEILKQTENAIE